MPPSRYTGAFLRANMSRERCEQLRANPRINPITGREINPGSSNSVYNTLLEFCNEAYPETSDEAGPSQPPAGPSAPLAPSAPSAPSAALRSTPRYKELKKKMTEARCRAWIENPTINPITGASIDPNASSGIYHILADICQERFGLTPSAATAEAAAASSSQVRIPKTIKGVRVPQTQEEWERQADILEQLIAHHDRFDFLYQKDGTRFVIAYAILSYAEYVPGLPAALVERIQNTLIPGIQRILDKQRLQRDEGHLEDLRETASMHDLGGRLWRLSEPLLAPRGNTEEETMTNFINVIKTIQEWLQVIEEISYNGYWEERIPDPPYLRSSTRVPPLVQEQVDNLKLILGEIDLIRANPEDNLYDDVPPPGAPRSLPSSKSVSEIASLSASRSDRKYSSSYKRHSALSQLSPLAEDLAPLPDKTRQELLKGIRAACRDLRDNISFERFDRMRKKNLQLVVRVGRGADGKHNCYYVKNLYNHWKRAARDRKEVADPMTRVPLTDAEKDDIMAKIRYVSRTALDPRESPQARVEKPELQFIPFHYPGSTPMDLYRVRVVRKYGRDVYMVHDVGTIPADMEPADFPGGASQNISSAVLVERLMELHNRGRLLLRNTIPYRCCRPQLQRPPSYWYDPLHPKKIDTGKMIAMLEEVNQLLD